MLHTTLKQPERFFSLLGSLPQLRSFSLSTKAEVIPDAVADGTKRSLPKPYRTNVDLPSQHERRHIGKFYTVPKGLENGLFKIFEMSKGSRQLYSIVGEMAIMVREPFLEIRDYIKSYDYNQPALRMVLYGRSGSGKTQTLGHLVHYAVEKDWLLIANAWMPNWMKRAKDIQPNADNPKIIETPVEAAVWLQQFRTINGHLLDKLQLKTTNTWKFSETESVAKGEPLTNLIAHGIDRIKHSNACVRGLLQEIKTQTDAGSMKTMVVLGGVNALWEMSFQQDINKQYLPAENFHLYQSFREILKNDWKNAATVVSIAPAALSLKHRGLDQENVPSYMPQYLLGKRGFEFFEPFLPILQENYSATEIESTLDYYIDMKFIQHPKSKTPATRDELKFLSGHNPRGLRHLCGWI